MGLLDLPVEILDLIINLTLPTGFESFTLSCKAVYRRSSSQIHRHNALKKEWSSTTNANPTRRADTLGILFQISRDPFIAQYINSLSLWDHRSIDDEFQVSEYNFRRDKHVLEGIKDLLRRTEYFSEANLDNFWNEMVKEDDSDDDDGLYATIALLHLLPHVKTLRLPDRWYEVRSSEAAEQLVPYVESLVSRANTTGFGPKPLTCLDTLLPFVEEGYDTRVALQCLQPFMMLRSIQNLYAVSCVIVDKEDELIPFIWSDPQMKSPLTRIEFAYCCIDATGLASLLANVPALTTFRYSHQTKWDGLEYDWNPGEFLETIANFCGERLLELAITIDELHGAAINGLSSFMRLPKLQKLEVDVEAFCGPPLESGQRLGRNAFIPEGAKAWEHIDIPCMGEMLPPSICEVHINSDHPRPSEHALRALFKNLKERRMDKLFFLNRIVIRQYRSSVAQSIADHYGITLEGFDENVPTPRPRSMMPQWKRDFDRIVGGIVMSEG